MRSPISEMSGNRVRTEFFVVEEVFGLLSVTFNAVVWHTTLYAALTGSRCVTKKIVTL